jgi:hypothetical protein
MKRSSIFPRKIWKLFIYSSWNKVAKSRRCTILLENFNFPFFQLCESDVFEHFMGNGSRFGSFRKKVYIFRDGVSSQ